MRYKNENLLILLFLSNCDSVTGILRSLINKAGEKMEMKKSQSSRSVLSFWTEAELKSV